MQKHYKVAHVLALSIEQFKAKQCFHMVRKEADRTS